MIPTVIPVRERLRLHVCQTEKFKAETVSVCTAIPEGTDRYLTTLLFSVLSRGCERYPSQTQINRRLSYLYGTDVSGVFRGLGDLRVVGLHAELVSASCLPAGNGEILRDVLELLRELLFHPLLDENGLLDARYVESEKHLQCDAIRARKNSPRSYALDRCSELLFRGTVREPSSLGTVEEVEAVTPEILTAHWRELISHFHAECFYVGRREGREVAHLFEEVLGGELSAPTARIALHAGAAPIPPRTVTRAEDSLPVTQGQLVMGFRFSDPMTDADVFALRLLQEVLGTSPVSKLFVNVRERLGLCYSCHLLTSRYTGTAFVTCGLDEENREAAEREILAQTSALAEGGISDAEWEAARTSVIDSLRQMEDSPGALDAFFCNRVFEGCEASCEAWRERILLVTREDVVRLARRMTLDTVFFLHATRAGEEDDDEED